jgi:hydrogenase-4 membrane subunit HyfE
MNGTEFPASVIAVTIVTLVSFFVTVWGAWRLEKKGYSFWGTFLVAIALSQPLGLAGVPLLIVGVSILAPVREE